MSIKSVYKKIRFYVRDVFHNKKQRNSLRNSNFSLITSDCTGGCVAKDLRVRMNSPTRNFILMLMIILSSAKILIII